MLLSGRCGSSISPLVGGIFIFYFYIFQSVNHRNEIYEGLRLQGKERRDSITSTKEEVVLRKIASLNHTIPVVHIICGEYFKAFQASLRTYVALYICLASSCGVGKLFSRFHLHTYIHIHTT